MSGGGRKWKTHGEVKKFGDIEHKSTEHKQMVIEVDRAVDRTAYIISNIKHITQHHFSSVLEPREQPVSNNKVNCLSLAIKASGSSALQLIAQLPHTA